ncbi:MAG: DUF87 domain-containing protein, partial [Lachnospiraceae bacterium]|nr:DUF87 domain-containing protein [Lachnospiraceae bacterium]
MNNNLVFLQEDREITAAEIWLPSRNETEAEAVCQFISSLPDNISLEYLARGSKRSMLIRGSMQDVKTTGALITASYPSASLHILDHDPVSDLEKSDAVISGDYGFSGDGYLPLKLFARYKDYDPVHMILANLLDLGYWDIVRIEIKLLDRRRPDWLDTVLKRIKAEKQRGFVTNAAMEGTGNSIGAYTPVEQYRTVDLKKASVSVLMMAAWVFAAFLFMMGMTGTMFILLAIALLLTFIRTKMPDQMDDPWYQTDLDMLKLKAESQQEFNTVTIRVTAAASEEKRARELQRRIGLVFTRFASPGGNSIVLKELREEGDRLSEADRPVMEMCNWELASLWHIPWNSDSVSPGLIPVRGIEIRCPDADEVRGFYRIGEFDRPNGDTEGVFLNSRMMRHNMFLIGKPGTGKTTLMEHIAKAAIDNPDRDSAVIVIDPHGDMFNRLIGCVPRERINDVILLDFGDPDYVVPYNPLDVQTSGLSPDKVTQMIVDIGKSLWTTSWGPRMQIPLQRSVLAIAAHNNSILYGDGADGLSIMGILLNADPDARDKYIRQIRDDRIRDMLLRYFIHDFNSYNDYLREQIILPVLSKAYRFEESPMLEFFSAPRSVLNPKDIIENKKILLVNTRMSELGSDLSDFIGSFIISVILKEIARQGEADMSARIPVQLLIDEFQTYSGVPWQELLAQLRKWGGRTVLGTQSFASMMTEDSRDLPGIIMSSVYSLFSFTVNGEDADYLSRNELSEKFGGPSRDTLISLDPYTCYARIMRQDGKLSRPFFFRTETPVNPDSEVRMDVLDARQNYARIRGEAVGEALDYLVRIEKYGFYGSENISTQGTDGDSNTNVRAFETGSEEQNSVSEKERNHDTESQVSDEKNEQESEEDTERYKML